MSAFGLHLVTLQLLCGLGVISLGYTTEKNNKKYREWILLDPTCFILMILGGFWFAYIIRVNFSGLRIIVRNNHIWSFDIWCHYHHHKWNDFEIYGWNGQYLITTTQNTNNVHNTWDVLLYFVLPEICTEADKNCAQCDVTDRTKCAECKNGYFVDPKDNMCKGWCDRSGQFVWPIPFSHCGLVTPYVDRDLGQHWLR